MTLNEWLLQAAMVSVPMPLTDLRSLRATVFRRLREAGWAPTAALKGSRPLPGAGDVDSLQAFIAGDADAFDVLCERHLGRMLGYGMRYLQKADAEDIVQEAFIVLFEKAESILETPVTKGERPNVQAFLFGIVRTYVRRVLSRRAQEVNVDDSEEPLAPEDDDALRQLLHHEQRQHTVDALERTCNPLEQDVVLLVLEGRSGPEIAQKLGIKPGHVRKLKHDALRKLRQALNGEEP